MVKKIPVRENTGNLEIVGKHMESFFAQVVDSLILKVKNIVVLTAETSNIFFRSWIC